jgi:hypothetical protein
LIYFLYALLFLANLCLCSIADRPYLAGPGFWSPLLTQKREPDIFANIIEKIFKVQVLEIILKCRYINISTQRAIF